MKQEIQNALIKVHLYLEKKYQWKGMHAPFSISRPPALVQGDYSTNFALVLAQRHKTNPTLLSEEIKEALEHETKLPSFFRIEKGGPGFINFFLLPACIDTAIKRIIQDGKAYGQSAYGRGKRLHIEYISANPTGELHVGNGRVAFYGDALARIFKKMGHEVTSEYYINDARESVQVQELGKETDGLYGGRYRSAYVDAVIRRILPSLKGKDEKERGYLIAQEIQRDNRRFITETLKIRFDHWFSEEELFRVKGIKKTMDNLKKRGLVYEKDGAVWLRATDIGDAQDWVIVRKTGAATYFLTDIAHHQAEKFLIQHPYNVIINILGADHQGHVKRMRAIADLFGYNGTFDILISQMVSLRSEGGLTKLSKRLGTLVLLKDLIAEVGLDVTRYFYLSRSLDSQMIFDLDLARKRTRDNPVFYIQYAYARMASIFRKKRENVGGIKKYKREKSDIATQKRAYDLSLNIFKRMIIQFPDLVEEAAASRRVHLLALYAYEVARAFQDFYEESRKIGVYIIEDDELCALARAGQVVIKNTLDLMGISAPERM